MGKYDTWEISSAPNDRTVTQPGAVMEHFVENQDEAIEVIAAYLERLGVEGLRLPYDPEQINRSAVLRYLINEKLQKALANPSALPQFV